MSSTGAIPKQSRTCRYKGSRAHTHVVRHTYKLTHTALSVMDSPRGGRLINSSKAAHFHTVSFPPLDSPLLSRLVARPSSATGLLTVCCSPFQNNPNFLLLMEFLYFCSSLKLFLFKRKKHIYSSKIPEASGP